MASRRSLGGAKAGRGGGGKDNGGGGGKKAKETSPVNRLGRWLSCVECRKMKIACSGGLPCTRCFRKAIPCVPHPKAGRKQGVGQGKAGQGQSGGEEAQDSREIYTDLVFKRMDPRTVSETFLTAFFDLYEEGILRREDCIVMLYVPWCPCVREEGKGVGGGGGICGGMWGHVGCLVCMCV